MKFVKKSVGGSVFLLLLAAQPLFSQVSGRFTGAVVDQTGAVIPGARISVFLPGGTSPLFLFGPLAPSRASLISRAYNQRRTK